MINRKYLLGLFSIFFITTIFAERNGELWDFGVVIKTSTQRNAPQKNIKSLSNSEVGLSSQVKALITNPFIPPTLSSVYEKVYDIPILSEYSDKISLDNIHKINLLVGRLTLKFNYQPIIDILSQIDFSQLEKNDGLDLNYWLANAFLHIGKYTEAEEIILANMAFTEDDRFHFLLAMTYEAQGMLKDAQEEYVRFIKYFPESDYKVTALIKSRMLGRR